MNYDPTQLARQRRAGDGDAAIEADVPLLVMGDFLTRDEFMRRWEAMPQLKFAELIHGVVYTPPPRTRRYANLAMEVTAWIGTYQAATPGCEAAANATWLMGADDVPQPDSSLRICPDFGGQSWSDGEYAGGAPEFVAEICISSTSYDLHQKRAVYDRAGVREYLAVLVREHEVRWHQLAEGRFVVVPQPADGVYRSAVFPGLWLDAPALLAGDLARVLAMLNQGIASPEHRQFVDQLAARGCG